MVTFQSKMSAGNKMDLSMRQIPFKSFRSGRNKRGIIFSPNSQQRWLICTKILLKFWIKHNICPVIQNQIILHLRTTG